MPDSSGSQDNDPVYNKANDVQHCSKYEDLSGYQAMLWSYKLREKR